MNIIETARKTIDTIDLETIRNTDEYGFVLDIDVPLPNDTVLDLEEMESMEDELKEYIESKLKPKVGMRVGVDIKDSSIVPNPLVNIHIYRERESW